MRFSYLVLAFLLTSQLWARGNFHPGEIELIRPEQVKSIEIVGDMVFGSIWYGNSQYVEIQLEDEVLYTCHGTNYQTRVNYVQNLWRMVDSSRANNKLLGMYRVPRESCLHFFYVKGL